MSKRAPKGTPTCTNIGTLAEHVRADGTIPNRVPAASHRHLKRCIDAGLAEFGADDVIRITDAGIEAIGESSLKTNRDALHRLGLGKACCCPKKSAASVRVGGWLICARKWCGGRIS
jgi:hypothetical protein